MFNKIELLLKTFFLGLVTCVAVILLSSTTGNADLMPLRVWTTSSMEKIAPKAEPGTTTDIQLTAARGEYEAFQIGIQATKEDVKNLDVTVSDLYSDRKNAITQEQIVLYREHYVNVPYSSPKEWKGNPSEGAGWYPDGLIPFKHPETGADIEGAELDAVPFDVAQGFNQPIWVDIFVPENTPPGDYHGTYTVRSDRGKITGKISLKVWDFTLPTTPSLQSAILFKGKKDRQLHTEILKHRLMPKWVNPEDSQELMDEYGLNAVRLPFWSGANVHTCKMDSAPSLEELKQIVDQYPKDLLVYVFSADEIQKCQNLEEPLKEWARIVRAAGAKHLLVTIPDPALYDDGSGTGRSVADIWVVKPSMYEEAPKRIAEVLAKGDQVWFYTGLKGSHSPKWLLDYPPIDFRIPQGFISQSLGMTGVLYWKSDYWTADPWQDISVHFRGEGGRLAFPGDGMLLYPGEKVGVKGVLPSMRLKWIREGVEDYEYIEILKQLGYEDWALRVTRRVGKDWRNWTKDPEKLAAARIEMGEKIAEISRERNVEQ